MGAINTLFFNSAPHLNLKVSNISLLIANPPSFCEYFHIIT